MKTIIKMKREYFLSLVFVLTGVSTMISCQKDLGTIEQAASQAIISDVTITRYPLFIPPTITTSNFTLTASPGTHDLGGGTITNVWQYNGSMPGPTIVAKKGDVISAVFQNNLPEPSIIHWHGMLVSHANDGQPSQVIPTGATYSYNFPIINRAALNWYHPHPHMMTGEQVYDGLAGAFIIRDAEEAALNLPSGKYEVPLVIRDASIDQNGNLIYKPTGGGFFGKIPLVNGTKSPYLKVDQAVYRFRVLIGATSRIFNLALSNGAPFILIGNDGGLLPSSSNQTTIEVAPAERLDVLIDFRQLAGGTKVMLKDLNSGWDLLQFRVSSNPVAYNGPLTTSSSIQPLTNPVTTRVFSFDGMSKINGKVYDVNRIDFRVPFGRTELWQFKTNGNGPHPVHVHGASFHVVSRTGGRGKVYPWEAGWKDVVMVNDFETVSVLIRFDSYKGVYLLHCHKLEHEDNGMMANFEVY